MSFFILPPNLFYRTIDAAKSTMLRQMYNREKVHYGTPSANFAIPSESNKPLRMNPIQMTRMGLSWKGAKEFNDAYAQRRFERLAGPRGSNLDLTMTCPVDDLFSGEHLMHPGAVCTGPVSSQFSVKELNPHGQRTSASESFKDPRQVAAASRNMVNQRKDWVKGELDDVAAVVASSSLSHEARVHGRRELGLPTDRSGRGGSGESGRGAQSNAVSHSTSQGTSVFGPAHRRPFGAPAHPYSSSIGTTFVRKPELVYESTHRSNYTTFAAHDAAAAQAALRLAAKDAAKNQRRTQAQQQTSTENRTERSAPDFVYPEKTLLHEPVGGWPTQKSLADARVGNGALYANSLRDFKYGELTQALDLPHDKLSRQLRPLGYENPYPDPMPATVPNGPKLTEGKKK